MTVKDYSTTASSNTAINGININTGMPPSNVDNALRQYGKDIREVWNDKEWFEIGTGSGSTTVTRTGNTTCTIGADVTSTHHVGRRVKIVGSNTGTIYSHISASAYSSPNTTITFASGTISASDSTISLYLGSPYVNPSVSVVDEDNMASNSSVLAPSQQSVKAYADGGTQTLTNKTINLANNTVTGTTAQFNTALSDNDFTTLAGSETLTNKTLTSAVLNTGISGTAFQDDDNFSSASASKVASSESIKAYVDTQVGLSDLDISDGSSTIAIDLDSETLGLLGGTGITSTASGNNVTLAIDGTVVTESSTDTLTNKTINASNNTLSNIGNSALSNSSVNFGGVSVALGGADTTPAFNLADATGYLSSNLSGNVTDSQLGSNIAVTKLADGSVSNTEFQYINSLSSNAQDQLTAKLVKASNLSDVASASTSRTNLGLGTISTQASNNVSITGGAISGMSDPSSGNEVATKNYVDSIATALTVRHVMKVATTGNVNLTSDLQNGDTIDGVSISTGQKVLVKSQSDATQNGVYKVVASGTASRDPDYDNISELAGGIFTIQSGSTQADFIYLCTSDNTGTLGSVAVNFQKVQPNNSGTVTSIGLTQSGSEFTIANTPVTSAGNITLDVNRISATKIGANTNISDTEYGYLNGVSSNIQTQLDNSASLGDAISFAVALGS
ncbi:prophage MuMc02 [uncultured Mediterranean phage uvMED]|nr:prophage MuMc02 [uncultured Mediterranean phage uvMED]